MTKVIAMYLPQYHEIKENNLWWGKGHTEWTSCKKATSLFNNHYQPRIPLENNYYDLTSTDVQEWQCRLAEEYGIYGFCYYHYWFEGKLLLEKPAEQMLVNKNIKLPFCFSWANHTWSSSLKKKGRSILINQSYGEKDDWVNHFNYFLPFFKDERYIKVDGRPMLVIYDAKDIKCWDDMRATWDNMAKQAGFPGLYYVSTLKHESDVPFSAEKEFDAQFEYQPRFALAPGKKFNYAKLYNLRRVINKDFLHKPCKSKYDIVWKKVINSTPNNGVITYLGSYTDWDTCARWGNQGEVHIGSTPQKFKNYFRTQIERGKKMENSDFLFITAWNEWSEGAYLEPDEKYKFKYLEAIRDILNNQ